MPCARRPLASLALCALLLAAPCARAQTSDGFDPHAWPDDAGLDGLVVPSRWLWERVGHAWDGQERARHLSDPTLWRAGDTTPNGWVPKGGGGVEGWLPEGGDVCLAAQRIAYALRLHRVPLEPDEKDAWERARAAACPRTLEGLIKSQETARSGPAHAHTSPHVNAAAAHEGAGFVPNGGTRADGAAAPSGFARKTGPLPTSRREARDDLLDPNLPGNAEAIRALLENAQDP